jgi:hypothetical protein
MARVSLRRIPSRDPRALNPQSQIPNPGEPSGSPPHSYRSDPRVPAFDDRHPIALMDGNCALCCFGARIIDRLDRAGEIRICPVQTRLGRALLQHYGLSVDAPETWLLLERGRVLGDF